MSNENLEELTVDELRDLAEERGVGLHSDMRAAEIIAALRGEAPPAVSAQGGVDAGQAQVQARMDEATSKGYFGTVPDPTPNYNYTADGNDEPTPETDEELRAAARRGAGLH